MNQERLNDCWIASCKGTSFSVLEPQIIDGDFNHALYGLMSLKVDREAHKWTLLARRYQKGNFIPILEGEDLQIPSIYDAAAKRLDYITLSVIRSTFCTSISEAWNIR